MSIPGLRSRYLIAFCVALAILLAGAAIFLNTSAPEKRWPEVLFQGTTNKAGKNMAVFRIVNHGPGPIMLWQPARFRTDTFTNSEAAGFTGTPLKQGEAFMTFILPPAQNTRWQAGFKYDIDGWRGKLEQWIATKQNSAPRQKWVWSDWVEP